MVDIFQTATFRLASGFAAILIGTMLVAFLLIYWRINAFETRRADVVLADDTLLLAARPAAELFEDIKLFKGGVLELVVGTAGLFDSAHHYLAGNLTEWPAALKTDGIVHLLDLPPTGRPVRAIAKSLPDGTILVLARRVRELDQLRKIVAISLYVVAVPAVAFSLLAGVWLSRRALRRVGSMHQAIERIMDGDLLERLPTNGDYDEMERLAGSVNRMLERIGFLVDEIKGVGDNIAHDLRTPLTRVRTQLDLGQRTAQTLGELQAVSERVLIDMDQCFGIITAILRIGEIDSRRRRLAFGRVNLFEVTNGMLDLYEPIAEEKRVTLQLNSLPGAPSAQYVNGDRGLLLEATANLIDNAIKFAPEGGRVVVDIGVNGRQPFLRVTDNGPGVASVEREFIMERFYRSDKSRHLPGSGLGLSLVSAIARLHDAQVLVENARPGAIFTLIFKDGLPEL